MTQPHPTTQPTEQPVILIEPFSLPEAAAPSTPAGAPAPPAASVDGTQNEAPATVDPGDLVFQLFLNTSKTPTPSANNGTQQQSETSTFEPVEEISMAEQKRAGEASTDAKNQDQQEQQPPPQNLPIGAESTIASQFGFQTSSFAAHIAVPRAEVAAPAAPTRAVDNVSLSDQPAAAAVDRIALTIRGANDETVRVEINQAGEMVRVGVNTADPDLASELRVSIPELVHRLDQQGYDSKVTIPSLSSSPILTATAHSEFRSGADTNGNTKSNTNLTSQDEPRQQRQRNPQRAWRELASQLQDD
jgi:hypothetical protein